MRRTPLALLCVLFASAALGCRAKAPRAEGDLLNRLQGRYTCTMMEMGGQAAPPALMEKMGLKYAVRGKQLVAYRPTGEEDPIDFELDESKAPAQLTFTEQHPEAGRRVTTGLLKYEDGVLTIVMSGFEGEANRPRGFKTERPAEMLIVLKRDN